MRWEACPALHRRFQDTPICLVLGKPEAWFLFLGFRLLAPPKGAEGPKSLGLSGWWLDTQNPHPSSLHPGLSVGVGGFGQGRFPQVQSCL